MLSITKEIAKAHLLICRTCPFPTHLMETGVSPHLACGPSSANLKHNAWSLYSKARYAKGFQKLAPTYYLPISICHCFHSHTALTKRNMFTTHGKQPQSLSPCLCACYAPTPLTIKKIRGSAQMTPPSWSSCWASSCSWSFHPLNTHRTGTGCFWPLVFILFWLDPEILEHEY